MVGVVPVNAFLLTLLETDIHMTIGCDPKFIQIVYVRGFVIVGSPDRAKFMWELGLLHLGKKIQIFKYSGGRGHKGLTYVRARE